MASLLLDTNIGLHYVRDNALGQRIVAHYDLDGKTHDLLISIVTEAELRALALALSWGEAKCRRMENFLASLTIIPIDNRALKNGSQVKRYVEVSEFCRTRGRVLSKNDLWIAAGAMATGATLLTTDKDFTPLDPLLLDCVWINPAL